MSTATKIAIGANATFVIGNESTAGVPSGLMDARIDFTSEDLKSDSTLTESASIRFGRRRAKTILTSVKISGSVSTEFAPQGFGRLIYHSLGTTIRIDDTDGSHGRVRSSTVGGEVVDVTTDHFWEFMDDAVVGFSSGGGNFYFMWQNADLSLSQDTSAYAYEEFSECGKSATATANADLSVTSTLTLTDGSVFNGLNGQAIGGAVRGVVYVEVGETIHRAEYDNITGNVVNLVSWDGAALPATAVPSGSPVWSYATIMNGSAFLGAGHSRTKDYTGMAATELPSGTWILNEWALAATAPNTSYTHYFQAHKDLPTGMSVEVHRDAASFLYTGIKIGEWSFTADQNALATQTHTLVGETEYVHSLLLEPVKYDASTSTGDTVIYVDREPTTLPGTGGLLTIGTRTDIEYTGWAATTLASGKEAWAITLVDNLQITQSHIIGEAVSSKTSLAVPLPAVRTDARYAQFEGAVFLNCTEQEVMAMSFTVNNNLAEDKLGFGTKGPLAIVEGKSMVDLTLTVEFDDVEMYKLFVDQNAASVELQYVSEDDEFVVDGYDYPHKAAFFFPRVTYTGDTPNIADDSYVSHDMPANAFADGRVKAETSPICVFITNTYASDY